MIRPRLHTRFHGLLVFLGLLCVLLAGCGPGKKEIAAKEAARQEIFRLKTQLRNSAQMRKSSSDSPMPPRVVDPGYEVRMCEIPAIPEKIGFMVLPGCGSCVCGNTAAGAKIVAYRKWYCKGALLTKDQYKRCVVSKWKSGEPTLGNIWEYSCKSVISFEGDPTPRVGETSPFDLK
jgi:hypothetical protein